MLDTSHRNLVIIIKKKCLKILRGLMKQIAHAQGITITPIDE